MNRHLRFFPHLFLVLLLPALSGCNSYFYWPKSRPPLPKDYHGLQIRHFASKDGTRLQGWVMPAQAEQAQGLVVYCHGADSNIEDYYEAVEFLPRHGYDLFLFDYRGYGASEGRPDRRGTIDDAHAAIDFAKADPLVAKNPVVLYGYSLGSAIAIVTASERSDVAGVIAESGFTSYREIGRKVVRERWRTWPLVILAPVLVSSGWDPIDTVDKISPRPIFFVHGDSDQLVPYTMSERLYQQAKEPKRLWVMRGRTHYNPPPRRHPEFERRVVGYIKYIVDKSKGIDPLVARDCLPGGATYD
ncbi:MAG: 2-succinyl-6-hydroxy-2,4-cyclohexadiene-1-carboxylate synthase [bacterium]|nr:2-succinyl-6-hydroxy-2,4-cyclohexadiene-1-carboxylate synthase [bacterium]